MMQSKEEAYQRIIDSRAFAKAERMGQFLTFLMEHGRLSNAPRLKETEIGTAVFGRELGYDPKADSIVRVEATRLRKKLAQYYAEEGVGDPLRVSLPPGKYELEFTPKAADLPIVNRPWGWRTGAALGVTAAMLCAVGFLMLRRPAGTQPLEMQPVTSAPGHEDNAALSPDGLSVAYTWDGVNGEKAVYVLRLGQESPVKLTSAGHSEASPVWSDGGRQLAYLAWERPEVATLRIHDFSNGKEQDVAQLEAKADDDPGLTWSPDGRYFIAAEAVGGHMQLVQIERSGGRKSPYLDTDATSRGRTNPVFSPNGRNVAFVQGEEAASADIYIAPFPAGAVRRLTFDRTVFHGLAWIGNEDLLMASYRERGRSAIWRLNLATNRFARLTEASSEFRYPSYCATSRKLIFSRYQGKVQIWKRDGDWHEPGSAWIRATGLNSSPQYSPDGKSIAIRSNRSGRSEIWVIDGVTQQARRLTHFNGPVTGSPHWSPDGTRIAFDSRRYGKADIFIISAAGGEPERLTSTDANEVVPRWSHDGKAIYFASDHGGDWALRRRELATGAERQVLDHAFAGIEDPAGEYLYFSRGPKAGGIFRTKVAGGPIEPVIADLPSSMWGNWALAREGVVYVNEDQQGALSLRLWRPGEPEKEWGALTSLVRWDGGLAVSPDGKTLLLARLEGADSDLYITGIAPDN